MTTSLQEFSSNKEKWSWEMGINGKHLKPPGLWKEVMEVHHLLSTYTHAEELYKM